MKLAIHLHLIPKLKMYEALHWPIHLYGLLRKDKDNFTFNSIFTLPRYNLRFLKKKTVATQM
jgi:hypothetical protein